MLVKLGVDISRLNREIRRTLKVVEDIYRKETGEEAIITSTYDGVHSESSLHYSNDAYDIRLPRKNRAKIFTLIKQALGDDFDVVREHTHIHIEYDPKVVSWREEAIKTMKKYLEKGKL